MRIKKSKKKSVRMKVRMGQESEKSFMILYLLREILGIPPFKVETSASVLLRSKSIISN
jgi:hypothetical protein